LLFEGTDTALSRNCLVTHNNRSVGRACVEGGALDSFPFVKKIREQGDSRRTGGLQEEAEDGEAVSSKFLVDKVQIGSKVLSIEGMIGTRVDVKLKCLPGKDLSWDLHDRGLASIVSNVVSLDGMGKELEGHVVKGARTRLPKKRRSIIRELNSACLSAFETLNRH
jgi:hypothetical protein